MRYSRKAMKVNFFTNILDGDALGLLADRPRRQARSSSSSTPRRIDIEFGNINTIGTRHVISYGGNLRYNAFDLSIAPLGNNRTEVGGYVQDEIFATDHLRFSLGARVDKYDNIADPVFSPRIAMIVKPPADQAIRVSYNKAFRSPSLINNYLADDDHQPGEPRADQPGSSPARSTTSP